jgi:uncharacterized Zn finger protein
MDHDYDSPAHDERTVMMLKSLVIAGEHGTDYVVSIDPVTSMPRCTCPAYQFAKQMKTCKHIEFAANLLVN